MNQKLLEILENNMHQHVSGEAIAQSLHMTRANVWKEIQKLKDLGYSIDSVRNLGYCLNSHSGNISPDYIKRSVDDVSEVHYFESLDSTNTYAKSQPFSANTLILASHQSQGRGRYGRNFYSPSNHGVYMSLVLEPKLELNDVQLVTVCAGLSVCLALETLYGLKPKIKWLNDILLNGKKLCGILTEGEIELETQKFKHCIVGFGINTEHDTHLPDSLSAIYTALNEDTDHLIDKNELIMSVLHQFYTLYNALPDNREALIDAYKHRSMILGKDVTLSTKEGTYKALDITRDGHLVVSDEHQTIHILNSGEVSIKEKINEN
ncbi:hypothetical protein AOC36_09170 [Erysipelothrix larvae]|uniref:Bifunctional ligase/repressor BirA n=1 Tax=Erysipelothrix larvae TaxID=1514105 RepID=A0A0X8H132_9FIRM|nr:biotin--[acetyl-CoA-carboxylase] ligase [Erysipelothrix larvae]AMC94152.1 hypothetical protein AOC36_09170 [Erysipelothrix larvae]